jgi:DNA-binding transcriptional MerR regulator
MEAGAKGKTYKIGQAAKLLDVKPFVLRFWEGEFKDVLVPVRTPSGQRAYTEANVALVREIKRLLYDEGLTIDGAKKRLRESKGRPTGKPGGSGLGKPTATAEPAPPLAAVPGVQPSLLDAPPGTSMPEQGAPDPATQGTLAAAQAAAQAAGQEAAHAKARAEALAATLSEAASELQAIRALLAKGPAH